MKQKVFIILMLKDVDDGSGLFERALQKVNILFETSRVDCKGKFLEEIKDYHPNIILSLITPSHSLIQLRTLHRAGNHLKIKRKNSNSIPSRTWDSVSYKDPEINMTRCMRIHLD